MAFSLSSFDLSKISVDWSAVSEDEVNQLLQGVQKDSDAQLRELVDNYLAPQLTKNNVNHSDKPTSD